METQKKQKELTDLVPQAKIKESQYNHDTTIKGNQYNIGLTVEGKMVFDSRTQFKGGVWKVDNEGNQTEHELVKKEI